MLCYWQSTSPSPVPPPARYGQVVPRHAKAREEHPESIIDCVAVAIHAVECEGRVDSTIHLDPADDAMRPCTACMKSCILGSLVARKSFIIVLTAVLAWATTCIVYISGSSACPFLLVSIFIKKNVLSYFN